MCILSGSPSPQRQYVRKETYIRDLHKRPAKQTCNRPTKQNCRIKKYLQKSYGLVFEKRPTNENCASVWEKRSTQESCLWNSEIRLRGSLIREKSPIKRELCAWKETFKRVTVLFMQSRRRFVWEGHWYMKRDLQKRGVRVKRDLQKSHGLVYEIGRFVWEGALRGGCRSRKKKIQVVGEQVKTFTYVREQIKIYCILSHMCIVHM